MTDNCYNLLEFLGNTKVKNQAKEWVKAVNELPLNDKENTALIKQILFSTTNKVQLLDTGSSWVAVDTDAMSPESDQLALRSHATRPAQLEQQLACLLYKLDKNVIIRNSYNSDDGALGVSYTTPTSPEDAYCQFAEVEPSDDDDEDLVQQLEDLEKEILSEFFLDDMPHLAKVVKKHLKHLDLEWGDFE
jgi:hypothetical protein